MSSIVRHEGVRFRNHETHELHENGDVQIFVCLVCFVVKILLRVLRHFAAEVFVARSHRGRRVSVRADAAGS